MKFNKYKILGVVFFLVICTAHLTTIKYNNSENQNIDEITDVKLNPQLSSNITWTSQGTIICNETNAQEEHQIISDGVGGFIITWVDNRGGVTESDVYAQRIDSDGNTLWDANGTVISAETWTQNHVQICSDGAGGAIITWVDFRHGGNDDIYAQRIDSDGNIKWTTNGEEICTAIDLQIHVQICSDGAGGAIITWEDGRGTSRDIYAQRIDSNGVVQWTADGVAITTTGNWQVQPQIISDGVGGAIITWLETITHDIYAQRINSTGSSLWSSNLPVCTAGDSEFLQVCSDGAGGVIISWVDNRNMSTTGKDVYAQRVLQNGNIMWNFTGEAISVNPGNQSMAQLCSDRNGGAIISWYDDRNGDQDIYAQKIDSNGNIQWALDGEAVCIESENQIFPEICSDEQGGAIITWFDHRNGIDSDVYAQWIKSNGIVEIPGGFPICTEDNHQIYPKICFNGTNGAIIVWQDYRGISPPDLYAQYLIVTISEEDGANTISFGGIFLFFTILSVLCLILFKKRIFSFKETK